MCQNGACDPCWMLHMKWRQDRSVGFDVLVRICGSILIPGRSSQRGKQRYQLVDIVSLLLFHLFLCYWWIPRIAFTTAGVNGEPAIYDPCAFYGHAEAEFGMSWCADLNEEFWRGKTIVLPQVYVAKTLTLICLRHWFLMILASMKPKVDRNCWVFSWFFMYFLIRAWNDMPCQFVFLFTLLLHPFA